MVYPEIKLAKRLIEKYNLAPPIDIFSLVKRYANVKFEYIDYDVDGISFYLKHRIKKPLIIINKNRSLNRIRFTLSHEFGHVIIPWHTGTIIDETEIPIRFNRYTEREANRFASELLIPTNWVMDKFIKNNDIESLIKYIVKKAKVSSIAVNIKLINCLPKNYIFVQVSNDNKVIYTGRSQETLANEPKCGSVIEIKNLYPYYEQLFKFIIEGNNYIWLKLPDNASLPNLNTDKDWRKILDIIIADIGIVNVKDFKQHLNGVIAYANGMVRIDRNAESLYSACLQRIYSKSDLNKFYNHSKFEIFLKKRIEDLLMK